VIFRGEGGSHFECQRVCG